MIRDSQGRALSIGSLVRLGEDVRGDEGSARAGAVGRMQAIDDWDNLRIVSAGKFRGTVSVKGDQLTKVRRRRRP